jgi:hypothetical protein
MRQHRDIVNLRCHECDGLPALFRDEHERAGGLSGVGAQADERDVCATSGANDSRILAVENDQRVDAHCDHELQERRLVQFGVERCANRIRADGKHRDGAFRSVRQAHPDPRSTTISGLRERARDGIELSTEVRVRERVTVGCEDRGRRRKSTDRRREQIAYRPWRPTD